MLTLNSRRPTPFLRPYVRAYAQRTVSADAPLQLLPQRLEQGIGFEFGEPIEVILADGPSILSPPAAVVGTHALARSQLRLRRGVESFCIFLRPGGVAQLFGLPMSELTNSYGDARAVLGPILDELWERMAAAASFNRRVAIIEQFLLAQLPQASSTPMTAAANDLLRFRGTPRITRLAERYRLSLRQFERRFTNEVGLTPKLFARIARFQTAIDWKVSQPATTWREIAHALGYHDQMHMVHDFGVLGGETPGQLVVGLGDSRPPALADAALG